MLRRMNSKYNGRCKKCGASYRIGDAIFWSPQTKALCLNCGAPEKKETTHVNEAEIKAPAVRNTELGTPVVRGNESYYTVDWSDFKQRQIDSCFNRKSVLKQDSNISHSLAHFEGGDWYGYSRGQIQRWLTEGFQTDAIKGLSEFIPPIREKRRLNFNDEQGEMMLDLVWSGVDNYFTEWTKRETIPGVALEIGVMFSAGVDAKVVNAYNTWICKTAYSLESSGVDCEITLDFPSWNMFGSFGKRANTGQLQHSIVKVKKENETSDFLSWSAMLSPAALRAFGFNCMIEHADASGYVAAGTLGRGVPERRAFDIRYDQERRVIVVENAYNGRDGFPESEMTEKMRGILKNLTSGKSN